VIATLQSQPFSVQWMGGVVRTPLLPLPYELLRRRPLDKPNEWPPWQPI